MKTTHTSCYWAKFTSYETGTIQRAHLLQLAYARPATIHNEHKITARLNLPTTELQDAKSQVAAAVLTLLQYIVHVTCYKGHAL